MTATPATDMDASRLGPIRATDGPLSQQVYATLKHSILTLDAAPGAVLRKAAICDRLGVSRSPVAEAIARLSDDGLVEVFPQSATRVAYFSVDDIREGAFLREALELAAVAKVAADHTEDQLTRLRRTLRLQALLAEDGDFDGFFEADDEFHALLMQFTGFPRLAEVAEKVSLQVSRARMLMLPTPGQTDRTLRDHEAIFAAVADRDPAAARTALHTHLGRLLPRIMELRSQRPDLFGAPRDGA